MLKIRNGYLAGSKIDWLGQHSVFPDYFRKLFYETGTLFPEFAAELGGGQNIYNFAYYGLFNPLYLISYLLPFVKMNTYIIAISLLEHIADGLLCYHWLGRHFKKRESFCAALLLVLAAPVVYHTSTQLMFVNYMPFLLLALIGYDRYGRKGKYGLLVISVLMMILTSFYFAVGGAIALFLYGVAEFKFENGFTVIDIIRRLWHQFYPVLLGCLLSLFYLLPVYFAMTAGRSTHAGQPIKELILPDIRLHKLIYSSYGMGFSAAIIMILCISILYKRCREKAMAVLILVMLLFPIFDWLLNGGLYLRDKAFVPFLPLMCWLSSSFFSRMTDKKLKTWQILGGFTLAAVLIIIALKTNNYSETEIYFLYIDIAVFAVAIGVSLTCWKRAVCASMIAAMAFLSIGQIVVMKDVSVTVASMDKIENPDIGKAVQSITGEAFFRTEVRGSYSENTANQNRVWECGQNLTTVYSSISNSYYQQFRNEILNLSKPSRNLLMANAIDNPIFLRFMGVKYIIGDSAPAGYEKIRQEGSVNIYENENAAPSAYVTNQLISEQAFLKLSYPEKQMALLESAVADTDGQSAVTMENVGKIKANIKTGKVDGEKTSDIMSLENVPDSDVILFLTFDVKNNKPSKDVTITVNGERNKLSAKSAAYYNENETFHYTSWIAPGTKEIPVEFGAGDYEISNIQAWSGTVDTNKANSLYSQPVSFSLQENGSTFKGSAAAEEDGWFVTSIPYDENFRLYVDGRQEKLHRVNTAFIGVPLTAGTHEIKLIYHAKGSTAGILATFITLCLLMADQLRKSRAPSIGRSIS